MKKNLFGVLALVLAIGFSAFTAPPQSAQELYFWYDSTGQFVGSSLSVNDNPLECEAIGDACVKGYLRSSQPPSQPIGLPDAAFDFNP